MKAYDTLSVMKFGGSSFATRAHLSVVSQWLAEQLEQKGPRHRIVCVVSAPSGLTEQYRDTLLSINPHPSDRLIDAALPLADSLGAVLVAAALQGRGIKANVTLGSQIGLLTDRNYTRARLQSVDLHALQRELVEHQIVLVPGGQAAAHETGETIWLGKNSSDLSAIALAAAFGCNTLEIFSDVPGVYSCDPNIVPEAYLLPRLSHAQAAKMSYSGAKVLHHRGVTYAQQHNVRLVCRANHGDFGIGTVLNIGEPVLPTVIPDARSQVFTGTVAQLDKAAQALQGADIPYLRQAEPDGHHWLAIPCGFFDACTFFNQREIAMGTVDARVISVVTRTGELRHELVSPDKLHEYAHELHRKHCNGTHGSRPPASAQPEEPELLSRNLMVFAREEGTHHV